MAVKEIKDMGASVLTRLKKQAKETGINYQTLICDEKCVPLWKNSWRYFCVQNSKVHSRCTFCLFWEYGGRHQAQSRKTFSCR